MKVAFAAWDGRISPVFDTASQILIAEVENGQVGSRHYEALETNLPLQKVAVLRQLGVEVLVCGAVSRPLADMVTASGIGLVPFVAGELEQIVNAYASGAVPGPAFLMPGCGGGRRRRFGRGGMRGRGGPRWRTM